MEIVVWIFIIALFILSFVGVIFPIIPSVLVIWGGFLLYQFLLPGSELSFWFWLGMVTLTVFLFVADLVANSYFVKKYGGSKWGERMAAVSVIVGSFVFPPFGLIIVPFITVFTTEFFIHKDAKRAAYVGFASFIGFLSSSFAKVIIQLLMIIWFFIEVAFFNN